MKFLWTGLRVTSDYDASLDKFSTVRVKNLPLQLYDKPLFPPE